jgi:hypothetical protein
MADKSDNPPFPVGRPQNIAIQRAWMGTETYTLNVDQHAASVNRYSFI